MFLTKRKIKNENENKWTLFALVELVEPFSSLPTTSLQAPISPLSPSPPGMLSLSPFCNPFLTFSNYFSQLPSLYP